MAHAKMTQATICVYCRQRQVEAAWRPFCSERCKLLDLRRWMRGDYRVAGDAAPLGSDDEAGAGAASTQGDDRTE